MRQSFWGKVYSYPIWRIFLLASISGLTVYVLSFFMPFQYCSDCKILVNTEEKDLDAYRISEISQRNASILAEMVQTKDFIREVLKKSEVSFKEEDLYNGYSKKISGSVVKDSSIVAIRTCAESASLAQKINQNANKELAEKSKTVSDKITLVTIDPSSFPPNPVFPRPLLQAIVVFAFVLLLGILYYANI